MDRSLANNICATASLAGLLLCSWGAERFPSALPIFVGSVALIIVASAMFYLKISPSLKRAVREDEAIDRQEDNTTAQPLPLNPVPSADIWDQFALKIFESGIAKKYLDRQRKAADDEQVLRDIILHSSFSIDEDLFKGTKAVDCSNWSMVHTNMNKTQFEVGKVYIVINSHGAILQPNKETEIAGRPMNISQFVG